MNVFSLMLKNVDRTNDYCFVVLGPMAWVYRQMSLGSDPRNVLRALLPSDTELPDEIEIDNWMLWKVILSLLSEAPRRKRLPDVTRLEHVLRLLRESQKILVLTGAGVSIVCAMIMSIFIIPKHKFHLPEHQ